MLPPPNQADMPRVHDFLQSADGEVREVMMATIAEIPVLQLLVDRVPQEVQDANDRHAKELQRLALVEGDWDSYVENARVQGQAYVDMGIRWTDWVKLVLAWRPVVFRRMAAELEGEELLRAQLAADTFVDIAMANIGEAYMERRAAQLKAANKELDNFAYVASHDLRSPLRAVDNLAGWLREELESTVGDTLSPDARKFLDLIQARIGRLDGMISGLLQYSRAGQEVPSEPVAVCGLLEEVRGELQAPGDDYVFTLDCDVEAVVHTPRAPLRSVLSNLMSNARRYRGDGSQCSVRVRRDQSLLQVVVDDDGPGIPEDRRAQVLRMFETLHSRDKVEATGMGLAIVEKQTSRFGAGLKLGDSPLGGLRASFDWYVS